MDPYDELTEEEKRELVVLYVRYREERGKKNYVVSDELRGRLEEAGAMGPGYEKWHPAYESTEHRRKRIERRDEIRKRQDKA